MRIRNKAVNIVLISLLVIIIFSSIVLAIPNSMNIQGKLTEPSGDLKTGTFNFTLRIYDNFTSGNKLYETNLTSTTDSRGVFDLIMENMDLPFDKQYYLYSILLHLLKSHSNYHQH